MNQLRKKCYHCKIEKDFLEFSPSQLKRSGSLCRACNTEIAREHRAKNLDKNKEYQKEYDIQYYEKNKDKILKRKKNYYHTNKPEPKLKEEPLPFDRNLYYREKRKNNINYKIRTSVSANINFYLKIKKLSKGGKSCLKYLPYTIQELKEHLDNQFEIWMNWNNYGRYNAKLWDDNDPSTWTWQMDHIIPHSTFKYTSMEDDEFKKCWALENLRPYSAKKNFYDGIKRTRHLK